MPMPATTSPSIARGQTTSICRACADESPALKIVRASDCLTTPWKNGGAPTTENAAAPEGASLDIFDWRISTAQVPSHVPFSHFFGVDRTPAIRKERAL